MLLLLDAVAAGVMLIENSPGGLPAAFYSPSGDLLDWILRIAPYHSWTICSLFCVNGVSDHEHHGAAVEDAMFVSSPASHPLECEQRQCNYSTRLDGMARA